MFPKPNRRSPLPVHVQLRAHLAHLIQSGRLPPGTRLPTVRQLARALAVNRNTVAKVFAELGREGSLSSLPGRGTFVSPRKSGKRAGRVRELLAVMDEAVGTARRLGVAPADFAASLYARAVSRVGGRSRKPPVLVVECTRSRLRHLGRRLAEAVPARVESRLIKDLRRSPGSLRKCRLAVTAFCHAHQVASRLASAGVEVVGLLEHAGHDTLTRLAALPRGTTVRVVGHLHEALKAAGLRHIRLVSDSGRNLRRLARGTTVVVCPSRLARALRAMTGKDAEILADDGRLDPAGLRALREKLLAV